MLSIVEHMHLHSWFDDSIDMEGFRVSMLSKGGGLRAERSETEGTEGCQAEQTRVRRNFYDRGQGLGGRTYIWSNYHRPHPGKMISLNKDLHKLVACDIFCISAGNIMPKENPNALASNSVLANQGVDVNNVGIKGGVDIQRCSLTSLSITINNSNLELGY